MFFSIAARLPGRVDGRNVCEVRLQVCSQICLGLGGVASMPCAEENLSGPFISKSVDIIESAISAVTPGECMKKVFISYAWEKDNDVFTNRVRDFALHLHEQGNQDGSLQVSFDLWNLVPGDALTPFMEKTIDETDYVLILCTPKYCRKSDGREGGVGYEGAIMTAELLNSGNQRKFIPVLFGERRKLTEGVSYDEKVKEMDHKSDDPRRLNPKKIDELRARQ